MPGKIVSRDDWLTARRELLTKEKEALRASDAFKSQLRNDFPMVKIEDDYIFEANNGKASLLDIFEGRKQLIVYHFMLSPEAEAGCHGCSFLADNLPSSLSHLNFRDTTLVLVSRAPIAKIEAFKKRMGWSFPWYSSFGTDFNYSTYARGLEGLLGTYSLLDMTPLGRQDSEMDWKLHDEYDHADKKP